MSTITLPDGVQITAELTADQAEILTPDALALVAVAVAILTGVIRTLGELSDPAELWDTGYGRSILYKIALLIPIGVIALYNRRIVEALRDVPRPNGPTLRLIRRTASTELVLSVVIVVIASVLAAQVPGGS